jgi:hypothetical protein
VDEKEVPRVLMMNLETAVTARGHPWPGKGIHYRMHPANVAALTAGRAGAIYSSQIGPLHRVATNTCAHFSPSEASFTCFSSFGTFENWCSQWHFL